MDVIQGYGLTRLDLDIEGGAQGKQINVDKLSYHLGDYRGRDRAYASGVTYGADGFRTWYVRGICGKWCGYQNGKYHGNVLW